MNFTDSIIRARERGLSDDQILSAIIKQNPHKEAFFSGEKEKGLSSTGILNNIIGEEATESKEEIKEKEHPIEEKKTGIPPELVDNIPAKPSDETKLWVRIFITLILLAFAATSVTFLYRTFFVPRLRPIQPEKIIQEIQTPRATPPVVKIYPERDSIIRFPLTVDEEYLLYLRKIVREEKGGELIRIIAEDQKGGIKSARITTLEDFFTVFNIEFPENFFEKIEKEFNLFVYTRETTGKLAFAVTFNKDHRDDVEWTIMRPWEETMHQDFRQFFSFWDSQVTEGDFINDSHKGDLPLSFPIRYREGSGGMGIYYSITEDRLLFATSSDSIKVLIERYYYFNRK
jgi:hypothetical protein